MQHKNYALILVHRFNAFTDYDVLISPLVWGSPVFLLTDPFLFITSKREKTIFKRFYNRSYSFTFKAVAKF